MNIIFLYFEIKKSWGLFWKPSLELSEAWIV